MNKLREKVLGNEKLEWPDVQNARFLRDKGLDDDWIGIIAGAAHDSNLDAVKDEARKWMNAVRSEAGQGLVEYVILLIPFAIVIIVILAGLSVAIADDVAPAVEHVASTISQKPDAIAWTDADLTAEDQSLVDYNEIYSYSASHASEQHGDQLSWAIRSECEANPLFTMRRATDGRKAKACMYDMNGIKKFGIAIYEACDDFVTSFPNKAKTMEKLIEYLSRAGYVQ